MRLLVTKAPIRHLGTSRTAPANAGNLKTYWRGIPAKGIYDL